MKTYLVEWGGISRTVSARDEAEAWALFSDAQVRGREYEVQRHPHLYEATITEDKKHVSDSSGAETIGSKTASRPLRTGELGSAPKKQGSNRGPSNGKADRATKVS